MQYMLMIYSDEATEPTPGTPEHQQYMSDYMAFTAWLKESDAFIAGDALQPVATATSVRVRGGTAESTDGPFAETREQLGGYYLVEARDLDHAIEMAGRIPTAKHGTIEVRPVVVW